jgi:DNA polymerase-3 subunit delta
MKLPPARVAGFIAAPDPAMRALLVYGPDGGLVRERADRLAAGVSPDLKDPFRVAELTAADLAADPARLHDEAAALSLTGGRRLVRVREAGDGLAPLFERFLADPPPGDGVTLVEAGELSARSALRRLFEGARNAAAIACYGDGPRELEGLAREVLGARGISLAPEALEHLRVNLGGDRQVSRQELEKLALMVGDGGRVGLAEAEAAIGDSAALTLEDVVFAAAEGDATGLERALFRAFSEGEAPVSLLRASMRHFQRLHLVGARLAAGASEEEALRVLRPPLFFKRKDSFRRQLRLWPPRRAARQLSALTEAERNAKRTVLPQETVCRDALLRVARAAIAAQRR